MYIYLLTCGTRADSVVLEGSVHLPPWHLSYPQYSRP